MPGPVSRLRGCTSTFEAGSVTSCGQLEVPTVDDRERPVGGHQRSNALERRLEERAIPDDPTILLGNRCPGDEAREGLKPGAIAAGQNQGPKGSGRRPHPRDLMPSQV